MVKHDYSDAQKRRPARSRRVDFLVMAFVLVLCCVEFF